MPLHLFHMACDCCTCIGVWCWKVALDECRFWRQCSNWHEILRPWPTAFCPPCRMTTCSKCITICWPTELLEISSLFTVNLKRLHLTVFLTDLFDKFRLSAWSPVQYWQCGYLHVFPTVFVCFVSIYLCITVWHAKNTWLLVQNTAK